MPWEDKFRHADNAAASKDIHCLEHAELLAGADPYSGNRLSDQARTLEGDNIMLLSCLQEILGRRQLSALFQPIIGTKTGKFIGYEGLIRGPADGPLHSPMNLFKVARANGLAVEVEHMCGSIILERFARLDLQGKLFLNASPECLLDRTMELDERLGYIQELGINPARVIIELTEGQPTYDYVLLREAVRHYRAMGFQIAIDDLGEGFSSLRLWSELRPDYVKIDMHFIQGINLDPVKLQFVKSIQEIAEKSGTIVIAEGVETETELVLVRDLGIAFAQGYHIGRPQPDPGTAQSPEISKALCRNSAAVYPQETRFSRHTVTALKLLRVVEAVAPATSNNEVCDIFIANPELQTLAVVDNGTPLGLISRTNLIDRFARPYQRELAGRKPCTVFMDAKPLIVDKNVSIQELSRIIVEAERRHLTNGFIITDDNRYLGLGTSHDLMRELTQLQINAARYANPLTLLPGNVPINEHIDRLLHSNATFCACYVDLDNFKPFNDVFGYRRGDDVIQLTAKILSTHCDPDHDFVGHIGGDDFIILFQSQDWEGRCQAILDAFCQSIAEYHSTEDLERGGYFAEDRSGMRVFHPLLSLSLGAVRVEAMRHYAHHQIAAAATEAKRQSKKMAGNSLFIDSRGLASNK